MIESAELTIYLQDGQMTSLELSPMQLKTIILALGLSFQDETSYQCFSDKGLSTIIDLLQTRIKIAPQN